jgi:hypothetical protein
MVIRFMQHQDDGCDAGTQTPMDNTHKDSNAFTNFRDLLMVILTQRCSISTYLN